MNYKHIYQNLIEKRKVHHPTGYVEAHHIVPKCIGGNDCAENIVLLTAREHYIAHWLLWKIHRTPAIAHAFWSMARVGRGQGRNITAAMYERARIAHSSGLSATMAGSGNHFYGRKHTPETKRLISEKAKARGRASWDKRSDESKQAYMDAVRKGKTEEHRKKLGRRGLKMVQNVETGEIRRVPKDFDEGSLWVNPRKLKPETKYKCDHCDMVTTKSMLTRWHNDNCKRKS